MSDQQKEDTTIREKNPLLFLKNLKKNLNLNKLLKKDES